VEKEGGWMDGREGRKEGKKEGRAEIKNQINLSTVRCSTNE
jgi:hypothetical protein